MKKIILFSIFLVLFSASNVFAELAIETSVSRSRLSLGEEMTLDIIVMNAEGKISRPVVSSIEGFSSYSQGHSQEISIINGRSSSRSVFSYVLIANSVGKKTIGPFEIVIGGRNYKIAPVEVEVVPNGSAQQSSSSLAYTQGPVVSPPVRALPGPGVTDQDIFVKAWLDKDEVFVNEPVILTYTIYTRLSSTYKGFEKEPVTTGFWVEDFPPEKTVRRTEQTLNGSRYVVADVRKLTLFPTQAGIFTIDTGTVAATVEVRSRDDFDSFFSYNVFGRRSPFPSTIVTQVYEKIIPTEHQRILVKALPETGKPASFNGAVGDYKIESSIDKKEAEEGNPVTYRVRVLGQGNINTLQMPEFPRLEGFKIYDSSSSANISKSRFVVEGDKITDTVLVPKIAGTFAIPALEFSYFDPKSKTYKELKTQAHTLVVKPGPEDEPPLVDTSVQPVDKVDVPVIAKDIRYIKISDAARPLPLRQLYKNPLYWLVNALIFMGITLLMFLSARKDASPSDLRGLRFRRSHRVAKRRLHTASRLLKKDKKDEFYAEVSRALHGYFADKLNIPSQMVALETIEQGVPQDGSVTEVTTEIKTLFDELSLARFAQLEQSQEEMKKIYEMADRVITLFEKVKLK